MSNHEEVTAKSEDYNETPKETDIENQLKPDLGAVLTSFIEQIDTLANTLPFIMSIVNFSIDKSQKELDAFVDSRAIKIKKDESSTQYTMNLEDISDFQRISKRVDIYEKSQLLVPKSFYISLISQYDAFLGRLIKEIYISKPELLNSSDKSLSYTQLIDFGTVQNALEYIIEKEVEGVLRKSHAKQFDWMEETFSLPLRKGLDCWPMFIEATERRNLFVHCDGIISNQYLKVCKEHKVTIADDVTLNSRLEVSRSYFEKIHKCLFEIAVKLVHVLWRKLFKEERANADNNLINIIYDLIDKKNYHLAIMLSDFATDTIKTHNSDETRRYIIVNKILSYKFGGKVDEARRILNSEDWSACSDKFLLAASCLGDDFQKAAQIMKRIGNADETMNVLAYREWPLFRDFRKTLEFKETYKAVFGEEFVMKEQGPTHNVHKKANENGVASTEAVTRNFDFKSSAKVNKLSASAAFVKRAMAQSVRFKGIRITTAQDGLNKVIERIATVKSSGIPRRESTLLSRNMRGGGRYSNR